MYGSGQPYTCIITKLTKGGQHSYFCTFTYTSHISSSLKHSVSCACWYSLYVRGRHEFKRSDSDRIINIHFLDFNWKHASNLEVSYIELTHVYSASTLKTALHFWGGRLCLNCMAHASPQGLQRVINLPFLHIYFWFTKLILLWNVLFHVIVDTPYPWHRHELEQSKSDRRIIDIHVLDLIVVEPYCAWLFCE
jgi:hypothetical protein